MSNQEPFYLIRERMSVKVKMRTEKHGDEDVSAYDVMLAGTFPSFILHKLHHELRPLFYTQTQEDIIDGTTYNTLRFDQFGPFAWALEMARMVLVLHDEDDNQFDLILTKREADKFQFELLPGGTVKLSLRVKLGVMTDEDDLLKLLRAANQQLLVSLHQAPIEEALDNFDKAEKLAQEPVSEARKNADKAFFNPVGAQTPEEVLAEPDFSDPPA